MRSGAREWYHILKSTDPAKVGFCLDLHWVWRGKQDPYKLLADAGRRTVDIHLRNSTGGVWSEDLGDGDIDHGKVKEILDRIGFAGLLTVELAYEGATKPTRPLEEDLKRSREYVRAVLGE
jgi:inosose dehydratase